MSNVLVLRNKLGQELELSVSGTDLQRVMGLLQAEDNAHKSTEEPGLSDEEIDLIRRHRSNGHTRPAPSASETEAMADRLMRGEEIGDTPFTDEQQQLSTPFTG